MQGRDRLEKSYGIPHDLEWRGEKQKKEEEKRWMRQLRISVRNIQTDNLLGNWVKVTGG